MIPQTCKTQAEVFLLLIFLDSSWTNNLLFKDQRFVFSIRYRYRTGIFSLATYISLYIL